jgi:hypothetical protein
MQQQAFDDAGTLLNEVLWYENANCNTLTSARNPETGEATDQLRVLKPLQVSLSSAAYSGVPDVASAISIVKAETVAAYTVIVIDVLAVIAAICVLYARKKRS